jgi:hypothetical protein
MAGPTYTYTSNTPQSPNPMNGTQPLIRANFQAIEELISVNHVGFNQSNSGKHNFISLLNTTSPGPMSGEIILFSQVTGSPNPCELFIQYPTDSSASQLQISDPIPATPTGVSGGNASQGWCSFPSGMIFRWGTFTAAANSSPQVKINFTQGPTYTYNQNPACVAPISFGALMPTGITVYGGMGNGSGTFTYVSINASTSSSVLITSNFLLLGY